MNEAVEQTGTETTGAVVTQTEQPIEAPPLTLKEHAQLHSERRDAITPEERTKLEEKAAHHSEAQKREKDGKFTEGKTRHRAQSQQARAEDVPRIRELTARAKGAEERLGAAEAELARLRAERAPVREIAQAERKVEQAESRTEPDTSDPEPVEDDPKYAGDYGKYLRDVTRWETRQALKADRAESAKQAEAAKREEAKTATIKTFAERLTSAKDKYGDEFEDTLKWDVPWLAASGEPHQGYEAIHAYIMHPRKYGADVLHYLHNNPAEVDALMREEPLDQIERLTLLGQRFASQESGVAGATGAAPGPQIVKLPPKPPTPVRTAASKVVGAPPTDGSLSVLGHAKAFKYQR